MVALPRADGSFEIVQTARRRLLRAALAGGGLRALPALAEQESRYPSRPIRYVMPFAAGGGPDLLARAQAPELARELGVNIVIDNRPGAGGTLAGEIVAQAPADGHTITLGSSANLINKLLTPSIGFDPLASFVPVSLCWTSAAVLVVARDAPFVSVAELVEAIRARPDTMNYGSGGVGTAAHLAGGAICSVLQLAATHVPYKGSVDLVPALLKGEIQFVLPIASTAIPAVRDRRVRALAVSSRARIAQLPDVPTLFELYGNELLVQEAWGGLWLPRGTPSPVVERLFIANRNSLASPKVHSFYVDAGTEVITSASPAAFAAYMVEENARWGRIVHALRLRRT